MISQTWNPYATLEEAARYDRVATIQETWALETLNGLPSINFAEMILDIGCGTGKITSNLAGRLVNGRVTGTDISEPMIHLASKKFEKETSLTFQVEDAMNLSFGDETFDVVTSFNSLHWLSDPDSGLSECLRVLKPGGTIVIVAPDTSPNAMPLSGRIGQAMGSVFGSERWREKLASIFRTKTYTTSETLFKALEQSGFKDIKVDSVIHPATFNSSNELEQWMESSLAPVKHLTEPSDRLTIVKELRQKWLEIFPPESDGAIKLQSPKLQAVARKGAD